MSGAGPAADDERVFGTTDNGTDARASAGRSSRLSARSRFKRDSALGCGGGNREDLRC
jgi:hypothetical protein